MISILDRYIAKELIGPFIFGIASFTCILAGSAILFPLVGDAVRYNIPIKDIAAMFLYKLPNVIAFTLPMAMLLATIMAVGRLSSDLELIAFRAAGISIYRLVVPVIVMGLLVSFLAIIFNEIVVPRAARSAEELIISYRNSDKPNITKNINYTEYDKDGFPLRIINVLEIDKNKMKNITIAEYEKGRLSRVIRAETGEWLRGSGWAFYNGIMHSFPSEQKDKVLLIEFEKELINIQINPLDLTQREKNIEEMNAKELAARIAIKAKTGKDVTSDLVNYHMKFAIPFASLIFSILGVSVGVKPHRTSSTIGFGLSLLIIIIYYILISVSMYLGLAHIISPLLSAWIPNLVIGLAGIALLQRLMYN
jgi:lipopolysaccharide export system permease protein